MLLTWNGAPSVHLQLQAVGHEPVHVEVHGVGDYLAGVAGVADDDPGVRAHVAEAGHHHLVPGPPRAAHRGRLHQVPAPDDLVPAQRNIVSCLFSPNVVCLFVVCFDQVRKLLQNCLLTAC